MGAVELILFVLLLVLCFGAKIGVEAAYRNGVNDGAMAMMEPWNPGYAKAIEHLRKTAAHRGSELRRRLLEEQPQDWE